MLPLPASLKFLQALPAEQVASPTATPPPIEEPHKRQVDSRMFNGIEFTWEESCSRCLSSSLRVLTTISPVIRHALACVVAFLEEENNGAFRYFKRSDCYATGSAAYRFWVKASPAGLMGPNGLPGKLTSRLWPAFYLYFPLAF